jgi:hypothetical protein
MPGRPFQPSLMFEGKARSLPKDEAPEKLFGLLTNIKPSNLIDTVKLTKLVEIIKLSNVAKTLKLSMVVTAVNASYNYKTI